jgi:hypothetical protein
MRGETVQGKLDIVSGRCGSLLHVNLQKVVQILDGNYDRFTWH